jgi:hypothetical protein
MDNPQKAKILKLLPATTIILGVLLLMYMIIVEDEPGAVPLLLVALGIGWHMISKARTPS